MPIEIPTNEPRLANLVVDEYGPNDTTVVRVITQQGWIPISKGLYRLVFGVPRRVWQSGTTLHESYFYELIEKMGRDKVQDVLRMYEEADAEPLRAFEIEGRFDPDGTGTLTLPDWKFRIYEGDKLYTGAGTLVLQLSGPTDQ